MISAFKCHCDIHFDYFARLKLLHLALKFLNSPLISVVMDNLDKTHAVDMFLDTSVFWHMV